MKRILISLLLAGAAPVLAQMVQSGSVRGFILDPSKAMVPAATVTITSDTKLITRTVQSAEDGSYLLQSLPPGNYQLEVDAAGFAKTVQKDVAVRSGDNLRIDLDLQPAAIGTRVEVRSDAAPPVNTVNANINQTVPVSEFRDLLLPSNEVSRIAMFLPGAVSEWVHNGRPGAQISLQVDGANDGDESQAGGNWQFNPPPEAISEFRITQNSYGTDLGRSSSTRLEMVTRGGTNSFHGSGFGFVRNEAFNARNWGSSSKAPSRYGYYGYTVGGPLKKERIFFFWANYYRRSNSPSSGFRTWPTEAQSRGDFGAWLNPGSGLKARALKDPATGQPFPGNVIPASAMDRNAVSYLKLYYPMVSDPYALANNGYTSSPVTSMDNYYSPRFDFRVTDKLNMFVRVMHDDRQDWNAWVGTPDKLHPDAHGFGGPTYSATTSGTYVLSPKSLFDFQVAFMHADGPHRPKFSDSPSMSNIPGWTGKVLYPQANIFGALPQVTLSSGYTAIGRSLPRGNKWAMGNLAGNFSRQGTRHNLKIGFDEVDRIRMFIEYTNYFGTFAFDGSATGDSLADFLLGRAYSFTQNSRSEYRDMRCLQSALYFLDEIKVSRKLLLTVGVRWETDPPYKVNRGLQFSRFSPALYDRSKAHVVDPQTGILRQPVNHMNGIEVVNAADDTPMLNFAPRVSLAYAPWGARTSIRAGYGFFFDHQVVADSRLLGNPPFTFSATVLNANFTDPSGGRPADPRALSLSAVQMPFVTPRTQKYSAGIQHEMHNMLLDVNYVGAFSTQQRNVTNVNQPLPNADVLQRRVNIDSVRPYYGFGPINMGAYGVNSRYDSLQAQARRGLHDGLFLQASYTLSNLTQSGGGIDPMNWRYDAGHASLDRRQMFRLASTYEPRFFSAASPVVKTILHGWQLSGNVSFLTGAPLGVSMQTDTAGIGRTVRANWSGSVNVPRTMQQWFDPQAFSAPAALTFGNSPIDAIYGPGSRSWDMGIMRSFRLREAMSIQYRFEAYNVMNHFNLQDPGTSFGTANFGRIVGKSGPRSLQMGLKILF